MRALSRVIGFEAQSGQPVAVTAGGALQVIASGQIVSGMIHSGYSTVSANPRAHIEAAVVILRKVWRGLRQSRSTQDRMWVIGHIEAFRDLGVLNETEYKGWLLQIDICPGHDEGFNPADCAYCLPKAQV